MTAKVGSTCPALHVQVRCPVFSTSQACRSDIVARVSTLNETWVRAGSAALPLERVLAAQLASCLPVASPGGSTIPFDRFQARPAGEPVLSAVWAKLCDDPLTDGFADALVEALSGETVRRRSERAVSAPDLSGCRTIYATSDEASGWIDRVNADESVRCDPFVVACHAYAEVALSHPYADGNGRLARALFQRAFARAGLLGAPLIPLGPLIYLNHKVLIAALVRLGTVGDWPPFLDVMARLTHKALAFTEHHLKSHSRPRRASEIP